MGFLDKLFSAKSSSSQPQTEPRATDGQQPVGPTAGANTFDGLQYYAGANCYYLMTRAASEGTRQMVVDTLDDAQAMGFTVIRTWAFNDGDGWNAVQTQPNVYNEEVFKALDWLLAECGRRGLKLQLTLTNYWGEFGGFPQYLRWSQGLPSDAKPCGDAFYTNSQCVAWFKQYVSDVINRVNSITGIAYKDDPVIHAWDLVNEPRCEGDASGDILQSWLQGMATYIKSLDPHHALTVGLEGFYGPSTPDLAQQYNPYNQTHGVDFLRNFNNPNIDFTSIHMYPDQWKPDAGDDARIQWAVSWVASHIEASARLGKPLCLQEFGKKPAGGSRTELFKQVYDLACQSFAQRSGLAGTLAWMFAHESYPDYDNYTIYKQGAPSAEAAIQSTGPVVQDADTSSVVYQHCQQVRSGTVAPS